MSYLDSFRLACLGGCVDCTHASTIPGYWIHAQLVDQVVQDFQPACSGDGVRMA